jgi:hypothetical protein
VLYSIYVPTARTPTSGLGMERMPSRELTGRCLLERNLLGAGRTWFLDSDPARYGSTRPVRQWGDADETGYMRVFLRYAGDPVPGLLEEPDEEWLVNPGGKRGVVVRLPWAATQGEVLTLARDGVRVLPSGTDPAPAPVAAPARPARRPAARTPTAPLVATPRPVCGICFQERTPTGACDCPGTGGAVVMEIQRPTRQGWTTCKSCDHAVTAYGRCGCS